MGYVTREVKKIGEECREVIIEQKVYDEVLDTVQSVLSHDIDEYEATDWIMGICREMAIGKGVTINKFIQE